MKSLHQSSYTLHHVWLGPSHRLIARQFMSPRDCNSTEKLNYTSGGKSGEKTSTPAVK